uniref:Uncharacterized protein n=1 Tax=Arundo donax TaxID=35708 RepID=A0A0A9H590_ARUDO
MLTLPHLLMQPGSAMLAERRTGVMARSCNRCNTATASRRVLYVFEEMRQSAMVHHFTSYNHSNEVYARVSTLFCHYYGRLVWYDGISMF